MRATVATSMVTAVAASGVPRDFTAYTFEAYVSEFGKQYASEEHEMRKSLFDGHLSTIIAHNAAFAAGTESWFMSVSEFTDKTKEELAQMRGRRGGAMPGALSSVRSLQKHELPASVDWRDHGVITSVKQQGSCGSCWAFAATETVESHYAIASRNLLELAPQALVSCMPNPDQCGGTGGCQGATGELAFNYTVEHGLPLAVDYPYTAGDGYELPCEGFHAPAVKAERYVKLPGNDVDALATAVATVGPITVSVAAAPWNHLHYGGGIFDGCSSAPDGAVIDHAVQLVGYTEDYWLIRNSWGSSWGEDGYIRLSRKNDRHHAKDTQPLDGLACAGQNETVTVWGECGVLFDSSYPIGSWHTQDVLV